MFRAITSIRGGASTPLLSAERHSMASRLPPFTLGPPGPGLVRPSSTFPSSRLGQDPSVRTATSLSRPRVLSVQNRELHIGAAGALHAFKDKGEIQKLNEPTIVSTILTRDQALKANPDLPEIENTLRDCGHDVEYGIDLTKMHSKTSPAIRSMAEKAGQMGVDLTSAEIAYLRSSTEQKPDDDALIHAVASSLRKSGVEVLRVTHGLDMHNEKTYTAPSGSQWAQAATAAGFELASSGERLRSVVVESVPNEQGRVALIRPFRSGESTFVSAGPPEARTGIAGSTRAESDTQVPAKT